jgi:hypothetical protein
MVKKSEYKKLDDAEVLTLIDDNIRRSTGYYDSQISQERRTIIEYYNGNLPKPAHDGNSKYVSLDIYDAVESMKAALLETFSSGNRTVAFAPQNEEDVPEAKVCTEYADFVANRQNNLFEVMSSVIHDGLIARVGIAKVFWETSEETTTEFFEDLTEDELDMMLARDDVELIDSDTDELGLVSGSIGVTRDTSQVKIVAIAPEELVLEPQAISLDTVQFAAHRTYKTLSDLRLEGYDEDILNEIGSGNEADRDSDVEVLARFDGLDSGRSFNSHGYQDQVRLISVYECYINLDIEGTGVAELWKITKAGNAMLDKVKVNRRPFIPFVPLPIPHAFMGNNFAGKLVATQNARTVLTRAILDHAVMTTNPRYLVVKGGLSNARELIDNRVGGIVNVTRPDAISPMPQAPLNPFIFQTIGMLDQDKEDTTGVSRLSQGLNKDALSQQNSAAMVEQLATMSQQRQKIMARYFANQFVKPMYSMIYQLVVENETEEKIVDLSGEYVSVNPAKWADKRDVTVELHLGYGEAEKESQKYMAMHSTFTADPNLQKMYTAQNQYALVSKVMEMTGIKNISEYLTSPDKIPPPQPDPNVELQMAMAKKQMEINERQTVVAEAKLQSDTQIKQLKLELEKLKAENSFAISSDKLDLNESQFIHKKLIDTQEMVLAQNAPDVTAIASPNG